jgi:hypothetical protein
LWLLVQQRGIFCITWRSRTRFKRIKRPGGQIEVDIVVDQDSPTSNEDETEGRREFAQYFSTGDEDAQKNSSRLATRPLVSIGKYELRGERLPLLTILRKIADLILRKI